MPTITGVRPPQLEPGISRGLHWRLEHKPLVREARDMDHVHVLGEELGLPLGELSVVEHGFHCSWMLEKGRRGGGPFGIGNSGVLVSTSTIMLLSATPNPPLNVPLTKDADMFMATGTSPNRTTTNYRAPSGAIPALASVGSKL